MYVEWEKTTKKHPIPSPTSKFYKDALKSIEEHDLPYHMNYETPADGDCFYHALYEIFQDIPLLMERAKEKSILKVKILMHKF